MMRRIDNIVIGELVEGVTLEMLGILNDEVALHISEADAKNMDFFLPKILVSVGLFPSTTHIRQLQKQRDAMKLCDDERILWRNLTNPELTRFEVGKKLFWLIVGDFSQ